MMITTVLLGTSGLPVREVVAPATALATALSGIVPQRVVVLPADKAESAAALGRSDLVVVASGVVDGRIDPGLQRFLMDQEAYGDTIAFALTVGAWPLDAGIVEAQLRPALRATGAFCPCPGVHVARGGGADRVLMTYAASWAPAIAALVNLARANRTAAA